ncbi:site-specific integrase [Marinobacter daepoensis]|uniref:site-specific integrase n=1 Tax=Marinobacter daepoensis TaxID=262077 RepID=UPI001C9547BA|nr:site-specific integrase [Marinobacter daepoensis]MBY6034007.1 site-specific integrase [Marinobacter daepoensis]
MFGRYIHKTSSGKYRFRMRIPVELQDKVGKAEIRQSLFTDSREEALALAAGLGARYKLEFLRMKKQRSTRREEEYDCLSMDLITMLTPSGGELRIDYDGNHSLERQVAAELYESIAAVDAKYEKAPQATSKSLTASPLLSECLSSYLREQALKGTREKSINDYKSALADFIELHGDTQVSEVSRESVINVVQRYAALPSNRRKKPKYRNLSFSTMALEELLDTDFIPESDRMSESNVGKFITRVNQLLNWVVTAGHRPTNPARGISKPKSIARTREPFNNEELKLIFGSSDYLQGLFKYPYQYWAPLIALLSGARINEICQLRTQDILEIDGVLCFRITGEAGQIKNSASDRAVPIHSKLIELGLKTYVDKQRATGETRLFPELAAGRDGSGQVASKWFKRYRHRVGVTASTKTFHSFRHTVATELSYAKCPDYEIGDLLGHKQQGVTTGTYRKEFHTALLAKTVERLDFNIIWPPAFIP